MGNGLPCYARATPAAGCWNTPSAGKKKLGAIPNPHLRPYRITASGLQGKKPLADRSNVGKGSRQIGHATLGKVLAPGAHLQVRILLRGQGDVTPASSDSCSPSGPRRGAGDCPLRRRAWSLVGICVSTWNCYVQGDSNCLIKTKPRDRCSPLRIQGDFCPVL